MSSEINFFRDYGILPHRLSPPAPRVRSYFSRGAAIGQYIATALMAGFGLGMAALFGFTMPPPFNLLAALLPLAGFGWLVYFATRNDYAWIELEGRTHRARHLYTRRIVERPVEEIDDLLTLVFQIRTGSAAITEGLLGRVRGVQIRFRDGRTPLRICRSDPKMSNAQELVEAILYRMSEVGELDAEIITFEGRPLVRRVFWKHRSAGPART